MFSPEELKKKRVGVLMGGLSAEREVSLMSGKAILEALLSLGYEALAIEGDEKLPGRLEENRIEVAFIGLHGRLGEDGAVQGLLEMMRVPYTGSGILASALAMNKIASRKIFQHNGLPVPRHVVLNRGKENLADPTAWPFPLPVVVKPCQEGSSVGVSIVSGIEKIPAALEAAFAYDGEILVEEYIPGREIQVAILDDQALGAIEIVPKRQFYDYETKYTEGLAEHRFPAPLPGEDYARALELGLKAHRVLGCEGGTRADLRYGEKRGRAERFVVLEVNTLPGMTPLSLFPEIARGMGLDFPRLVERILAGAGLKVRLRGR